MVENSTAPSIEKNETQKWNQEIKSIVKENSWSGSKYQTVCGEILVDSPAKENPKIKVGKVFYTAYFSLTEQERPLIFLFNGGPGSSSVWLHFGAFGPQRVSHLDVAMKSSSSLVENAESLFDAADLIFVDPIGTGFSSCAEGELKNFCTENADSVYLSQFITCFLSQHKAWGRKIFLCGESYGGYRVSLIAQHLIKKESLHPEGIILIAPFISGIAIEDAPPNILGEAHYLISFILTAWYHKRSSLNQTCKNEEEVYQIARDFAYHEYLPSRLEKTLFFLGENFHKKLSQLTGISKEFFCKYNLNVSTFSEHLFPKEKCFPGRIDGRYVLEHPLVMNQVEYIDPSHVTFSRRLNTFTQNYYFTKMCWEGNKPYVLISDEVSKNWRYEEPFYSSAFSALQTVLKLSPDLRIYAAAGYYDLAVPAATVEFDLKQLPETKDMEKRIQLEFFQAGHMMYVHEASHKKLVQSIRLFLKSN
jgi:carboxypeptidase C (cathepsin A)